MSGHKSRCLLHVLSITDDRLLAGRVARESPSVLLLYHQVGVLDVVEGALRERSELVRPHYFAVKMLSGDCDHRACDEVRGDLDQVRLLDAEVREKLSELPDRNNQVTGHSL